MLYFNFIFDEPHDDTIIVSEYQKSNGLMENCLSNNIAPVCMVKIHYIGGIRLDWPLVCLLETGSTGTMVQAWCLPPGAKPKVSNQKRITTIINGNFEKSLSVNLSDLSRGRSMESKPDYLIVLRVDMTSYLDLIFQEKLTWNYFCKQYDQLDGSIHHYEISEPLQHACWCSQCWVSTRVLEDSLFIQYLNLILNQEDRWQIIQRQK